MLALFAFTNPVAAQELSQTEETKPVIKDLDGLRLEIVQRTQDPTTKEVQFDLVIYPKLTSERVQLTWTVTGTSELLTPEKVNLSIVEQNPLVVSAILKPRQLGVTEVLAKVEVFSAGGVFLATAKKTFGTFASGQVYPISNDFRLAEMVGAVRSTAIFLLVLIALYWVSMFVRNKVVAWLQSR